jgi:hypothetical protein
VSNSITDVVSTDGTCAVNATGSVVSPGALPVVAMGYSLSPVLAGTFPGPGRGLQGSAQVGNRAGLGYQRVWNGSVGTVHPAALPL